MQKYKFRPYGDYGLIQCPACLSIWTPNTLVYGIKLRDTSWPIDTSTSGGDKFIPGNDKVPENKCPGCGRIDPNFHVERKEK